MFIRKALIVYLLIPAGLVLFVTAGRGRAPSA